MKNQYFGDIKDLFKYDLAEFLVSEIPELDKFTFIPMLTPDDKGPDGNKLDYEERPGSKNKKLVEFLDECVKARKRNVKELERYSKEYGLPIDTYERAFNHKTRADYFSSIPDGLLDHALIVVDPDNGLEVKHSRDKHLLFSEVSDLYSRMSDDTILVIFQHFWMVKHEVAVKKREDELRKLIQKEPLWIHDNQIVFFILCKKDSLNKEVQKALSKYQSLYLNLETSN